MKNSSQRKQQGKVMARDVIKTHISNMPDEEFKATIIKICAGGHGQRDKTLKK